MRAFERFHNCLRPEPKLPSGFFIRKKPPLKTPQSARELLRPQSAAKHGPVCSCASVPSLKLASQISCHPERRSVILSEFWRLLRRNESKDLHFGASTYATNFSLTTLVLLLQFGNSGRSRGFQPPENERKYQGLQARISASRCRYNCCSRVPSLKLASQISCHPERILARFAPK